MARRRYTTILVDELDQEYMMPMALARKTGLNRVTLYRLLKKMKAIPKYRKSYLELSHNLRLVNVADFKQYLIELDGALLKNGAFLKN